MSLIGGYYSFERNKRDTQEIYECVKAYRCLSNERRDDDEVVVYEHPCGHLFAKRKKGIRSLVSACRDKQQNLFISLGFLTQHDWQDWDFEQGALKPQEHYREDYADRLTRAEGQFIAVYVNDRSQALHIVNDRFGARPLYYSVTDDGFYFCSNLFFLTRLCGRPIELDPIGLLQMYLFGNTEGPHTHLRNMERLSPATHLTIRDGAIQKQVYWRMKFEPDFGLDPKAHAEVTFFQLQKSVRFCARLSPRTLLPLSGGLDSRIIAACLPSDSAIPAATMVMQKPYFDAQYAVASEVARALGLRHSAYSIAPIISQKAEDLIRLCGGISPLQHSAKSAQGPFDQYDLFLDGGPGGDMKGSSVLNMYYALPEKREEILSKFITPRYFIDTLRALFDAAFLGRFLDDFLRTPQQLIDQLPGQTAAEIITLKKMVYRQPAFTCAQPPHSHPYGTSVYPLLGYGYMDCLLKLPPLWLFNKQFSKFMIYQCAPRLRAIPYANTGELLSGRIGKARAPMIDYKLWALKRRLGVVCRKLIPKRTGSAESMGDIFLVQSDKALLAELRDMLTESSGMRDYFNVDFCVDYLNRFEAGGDVPKIAFSPDHPVGFLAAILYTCRCTGMI